MKHLVVRGSIAALFLTCLAACGSGPSPSAAVVDACQRAVDRDIQAGRVTPRNPDAFCKCFSDRVESSADVTAAGKSQATQFFDADGALPAPSEQDFGSMQNIALECFAESQ